MSLNSTWNDRQKILFGKIRFQAGALLPVQVLIQALQGQAEGLGDADTAQGTAENNRQPCGGPPLTDLFLFKDIVKIAFVELDNQGQVVEIQADAADVFFQVVEAFKIIDGLIGLGISHKDNAVGSHENGLAGGIMGDLPRDRVKLDFDPQAICAFN